MENEETALAYNFVLGVIFAVFAIIAGILGRVDMIFIGGLFALFISLVLCIIVAYMESEFPVLNFLGVVILMLVWFVSLAYIEVNVGDEVVVVKKIEEGYIFEQEKGIAFCKENCINIEGPISFNITRVFKLVDTQNKFYSIKLTFTFEEKDREQLFNKVLEEYDLFENGPLGYGDLKNLITIEVVKLIDREQAESWEAITMRRDSVNWDLEEVFVQGNFEDNLSSFGLKLTKVSKTTSYTN